MTIIGTDGSWVVPPGRAIWMPPRAEHQIRLHGEVSIRTIFVREDGERRFPAGCEIIEVSPLLREAIVAATRVPLEYDRGGRDERVMELILDEVERAERLNLYVPMPSDTRLAALCALLVEDPANPMTQDECARSLNMATRTLSRLFLKERGMTFGAWRQRMRLILSLQHLAARASVLEVALDSGYRSPSAFSAMFRATLGVAPSVYLKAQEGR